MKFQESCQLFEQFLLGCTKDYNSPLYDDSKPIEIWNEQREYVYLRLFSFIGSTQAFNIRKIGKNFDELYADFICKVIAKEPQYGFGFFDDFSEADLDDIIKIFKQFLSKDYTLSTNISELTAHMIVLYFYYCFMTLAPPEIRLAIPSEIIHTIDDVNTRLIEKSTVISMKLGQFAREQERVAKGDKGSKLRKELRKRLVLEEYNKIKRKDDLSPNRIATIIRERLEKKSTKIPAVNTIKTYLREEGLL